MDVKKQLRIPNCTVLSSSFNRPNLRYFVRPKSRKSIDDIATIIKETHRGSSGIIYCFSKDECERMSDALQKLDIAADFYHAGLTPQQREIVQKAWTSGTVQVICATIAFGMGINKANVRFVIHNSLPKSLEGYFQETGRAGRDGKEADCVLFYAYSDKAKIERLTAKGKRDMSADQYHVR